MKHTNESMQKMVYWLFFALTIKFGNNYTCNTGYKSFWNYTVIMGKENLRWDCIYEEFDDNSLRDWI